MATLSYIFVFFIVFFACIASSNQTDELTQAINQFSADLFWEVSQDDERAGKNFLLSGMSAHIVLTLLSLGATSKTLFDMDNALYVNIKTKYEYKQAISKMNNYQFIDMDLETKLYIKEGPQYVLDPLYEIGAIEIFYSELEMIDFDDTDGAAQNISGWVAMETEDKVEHILEGNDIEDFTTLVLVNTIYLEGGWDKQFNSIFTTYQPFFINYIDITTVEMMFQYNQFDYQVNEYLDAKILKMDFEGQEASMVFFLPNTIDGLSDMEAQLQTVDMKALVDSLQPEDVAVFLPKIHIGLDPTNFDNDLDDLGMGDMYTDRASFELIPLNPAVRLKVDTDIHENRMILCEDGVTTGAGDAIVDVNMLPLSYDNIFYADHPYFFILMNEDEQIVLSGHFMGKN